MQRYRLGYATEFRATGLETAGTGETLTGADQRSRSWRDDCCHPNYGGNSNNYCRLIQRTAGYGPVCPVVWEGRAARLPLSRFNGHGPEPPESVSIRLDPLRLRWDPACSRRCLWVWW